MAASLLATARKLVDASSGPIRQDDLKRAISTAYYALFHEIARVGADRLVGTSAGRSVRAWNLVYRALDHRSAKAACASLRSLKVSAALIDVGDAFQDLQEKRHLADYDPQHRVSRADALAAIKSADDGIAKLASASPHEQTEFAAFVLFRRR